MPDWSYHPLLRPAGIALHGERTRELTLARLRAIASRRPGAWLIRFLGHMAPDATLAFTKAGLTFPSPVMLSSSIDPVGIATGAFSQFEFGAIEVASRSDVTPPTNGVAVVERGEFASVATGRTHDDVASFGQRLIVEASAKSDEFVGFVRQLRAAVGPDVLIAAGGYVATPRDGLELHDAGADLIVVGEGLATAGPGIAKRINEAILARRPAEATPSSQRNWIAGTMFGIGVVIAAFIAIYLSVTSVILRYDETFAHTSRMQLHEINHHLLHFMKHDRLSYGGATLSLGIMYTALAAFGVRRGEKWAFHTLLASGIAGFATFFLFIGFGYFDIGNSAVNVVLLPFFLVAVIKPPRFISAGNNMDLDNDRIWRTAVVGQLLLVTLSIGLIVGGAIICIVGSTNVFVISDLHFLHASAEAIRTQNEHLLPLIAHDRVSFGGAIICNGIAALLISLWGFRRGEAWVWWTLLIAGTANLGFTFYAHLSTGYIEFGHLLPVVIGALFFVGGLVLSRPFLCDRARTSTGVLTKRP